MRLVHCYSALLLLVLIPSACRGANILVFPAEGSHWINMDIMLRALHERGHSLTVLRSTRSWYVKENSTYYESVTVKVEKSIDEDLISTIMKEVIDYERGTGPFIDIIRMTRLFMEAHEALAEFAIRLLDNPEFVNKLRDSKFDLMLTDPCWGGGVIVAKYFNLPLVYNVRWLLGIEAHLALAPSPLSYIPITGTGNTDKMTFWQRVKNLGLHLVSEIQNNMVCGIYQKVCDRHLGPGVDYKQLMLEADIWLMRGDFVFEFPRPTMPNVVYMGGFQCKPAKPLPDDLEEFVQGSGEHGFIVMSLGTFVSELPADMVDEFAAAFAKLPQRVIWRFKGEKPKTLGNNTLLVDWMPQNDLLGHPKIKLFVAHGGTNGVQETIYHGVPVVGIPIFFDQYDNLMRLKERGGAEILQLISVDKDDNFLKTIQKVMTEPSYRMNMQRLSRLHRDKPIQPLDNALFWIEFVIRHKGAAHLRTESYKMPWYAYYSFDVYLFLVSVFILILGTAFKLIRCLLNMMCKKKQKKE